MLLSMEVEIGLDLTRTSEPHARIAFGVKRSPHEGTAFFVGLTGAPAC